MSSRSGLAAVILIFAGCILAISSLSCNVAAVPGRFTYVVKYEVSANAAVTVDITGFTNEDGNSAQSLDQAVDPANPWIYEFPDPFSYDDPAFYSALSVMQDGALPLNAGETVYARIIWKDYRLDFEDQVIAFDMLYNDGSVVVDTVDLIGPELPLP